MPNIYVRPSTIDKLKSSINTMSDAIGSSMYLMEDLEQEKDELKVYKLKQIVDQMKEVYANLISLNQDVKGVNKPSREGEDVPELEE